MNRRALRYNPNRRRDPDETALGPVLKLFITVAAAAAAVVLAVSVLRPAAGRLFGGSMAEPTATPEAAAASKTESAPIAAAETLVLPETLGVFAITDPSIGGDTLLFCAGADAERPDALFEYGFATGEARAVGGVERAFDAVRNPVQNESYLVYMDAKAAGGGAIRVLDKAAGTTRWLADVRYGVPKLHLDGQYLCYTARTDEQAAELYVIDLAANRGLTLARFSGAQYGASEPDMAGGVVVYAGADAGGAGALEIADVINGARETWHQRTLVHDPRCNDRFYAFLSGAHGKDADLYVMQKGGKAALAARGVVDYALAADYAVYMLDGTIYAFGLADGKTHALSEASTADVLLAAGGGWALWRETGPNGAAVYRYQDLGREHGQG